MEELTLKKVREIAKQHSCFLEQKCVASKSFPEIKTESGRVIRNNTTYCFSFVSDYSENLYLFYDTRSKKCFYDIVKTGSIKKDLYSELKLILKD